MKGDIVVGLDIGTTKICTVIGEVVEATGTGPAAVPPRVGRSGRFARGGEGNSRIDILAVGVSPSTGIRRGVVVDIDATVRAIEDSVQKAARMAGVDVHSVLVGVTGEHIASLNSRGVVAITHADREVTQEDVDRVNENARVIVLPPDREIIHSIARGYAIDGQNGIRAPVGMSGTRLEVETHIVTGATTFLQNVAKCVDRASLHVEDTVLEPIATGEAVLMPAERELGVVLVDIGGGTSDLAIFLNGEICYSAVIPVGGQYVTRDVSAGLRTTLEEAERIKTEHGLALAGLAPDEATFEFTRLGTDAATTLPTKVLAEIIEPRMAELFQMVAREINRSDFGNLLPAGVVLSGGGALLAGVCDQAAEATGLPARVGFPGGMGGLTDSVASPSFATAVGLVQWGGKSRLGLVRRETPGTLFAALRAHVRRWFNPAVAR